jgi:hypothetical protein
LLALLVLLGLSLHRRGWRIFTGFLVEAIEGLLLLLLVLRRL